MEERMPELEDLIPHEELAQLADNRLEDTLQLLAQLDYLQGTDYAAKPEPALAAAISAFRIEYRQVYSGTEQSSNNPTSLDTEELLTLNQLVSLEGETDAPYIRPQMGDDGLWVRVLHYRLEVLGLYAGSVGAAASAQTLEALAQLSVYLDLPDIETVIRLTGDIPQLCAHLLTQKADDTQTVYFYFPQKNLYRPYGLRQEFTNRLRRTVSRRSDEFRWFRREVANKAEANRPFDEISTHAENPLNGFLLRLLQVRQWINGYYDGMLDQQIGELTFESILDFFRMEVESGKVSLPGFREFIAHLGEGYWVFNIRYFFDLLFDNEQGEAVDPSDVFAQVSERLERETDDTRQAFQEQMEEAWDSASQEMRAQTEEQLLAGRRIVRRLYFGVKNFFRNVGRKIAMFFRWILNKARQVFTLFKNMLKRMYREIREALLLLRSGMRFIAGGRRHTVIMPGRGEVIHAEVQFGADAVLILPEGLSPELAYEHALHILAGAKGLNLILGFTGRVVSWALRLSNPLGWVQFAIKAAFFFRDMLRGRRPSFAFQG